MMRLLLCLLISLVIALPVAASEIPEKSRTSLGLYLSASEAYALWQKDPVEVNLLDVRTPEEYIFVGHAPDARNIPKMFMSYEWDAEKKRPVLHPNTEFVGQVEKHYSKNDVLLIMCRSGERGAASVNALAEAGFTRAYNIVDGFEGIMIKDKKSLHFGRRHKNGWKNSGAPWGYPLDPELMYLETKP